MVVNRGKYRGLKLDSLAGENTRPTSAKAKEAIFSMLNQFVYDAKVLDLFSGSGALGIEALSSNALHVDFNDINKDAYKVISNNLNKLKDSNYKLYNLDYKQLLIELKQDDKKYDLVFLDPPYKLHLLNEIITLLKEYDLLNEDYIIVCESDLEESINVEGIEIFKEKKYGTTIVRFVREEHE